MSSTTLQDQISRATNRLAQLKAREMLKERSTQTRLRSRARREDAHRKILLGGLVIAAGADQMDDEGTLVGLLLDARERLKSPDYRQQARERGIQHLEARRTESKATRGRL